MEVKDGLSRSGAHVEDSAVPLLDLALTCDGSRSQVTAADQFGVVGLGFFQSREMFLRNYQHMRRGLRVDVFEREHMLVFMDFLGWNLSANDAAEKTIGIGHSVQYQ